MIDRAMRWNAPLCQYISEYSDRNVTNEYRPVAVGRYGIRTRESIYSKELAADYSKNKLIYKDTLTVGMGSVQIDIGVLTDNVTYSVSPAYHTYKISDINSNYLDYCLQQRNQDMFIRYVKRGSRQGKSIDLKRWITYEIPVYPMEVQHEIVDNLNRVKKIITFRQHQLTELDNLVKSRFVEMFGEPTTNSKNWKRVRFDSLCENLDGKRRPITSTDREAGPYPYYGASGIVDHVAGFIFDEDILLVSEDGANLLARSTPIAFSVSGKVWVNNHAHVLRFNNFALQKYVEYYFSMISIEDYITGSTQPKLNQAKLNSMMIPLPSDSLQEVFMRFITEVDKSKLAVQQSLEKLETLKKSLMQQYFG